MRKTRRREKRTDLNKFDRVYIQLPECAPYAKIIAMPTKTIYYNTNGIYNIDRVFYDFNELAMCFEAWGV